MRRRVKGFARKVFIRLGRRLNVARLNSRVWACVNVA